MLRHLMEAALQHGILDTKPRTAAEVASMTGASGCGVRMLMEGLVGIGLVTRSGDSFGLAPDASAFLVSTEPAFQGGFLRHTSGHLLPKWLQLTELVRTGKPAVAVNQEGAGTEFFTAFVEDLFPMGFPAARALAEHLQLGGTSQPISVLDIAAGSGVWSIAFAMASPQVKATAVDWPGVIPVTRKVAGRFAK